MRTTCIMNLKGGTGKTVTAINLAAGLALRDKRNVLIVDADAQANTTEFFHADRDGINLAEILLRRDLVFDRDAYAQHTDFSRLDILPANDGLMDMDVTALRSGAVHADNLARYCNDLAESDAYDHVIIDCPPAFSAASAAALAAADEVVIPVKLDAFSVQGLANLLRQVQNMRNINNRLRVAGCLLTMWYNDPMVVDAEAQLRECGLPIYDTHIRRSDKVDGSTFAQDPLDLYSFRSAAAVDYRRFVCEFDEKSVLGGAIRE